MTRMEASVCMMVMEGIATASDILDGHAEGLANLGRLHRTV